VLQKAQEGADDGIISRGLHSWRFRTDQYMARSNHMSGEAPIRELRVLVHEFLGQSKGVLLARGGCA
jgi:hypothetical protein